MIENTLHNNLKFDKKYIKSIHSLNLTANCLNWQTIIIKVDWSDLIYKLNLSFCQIDYYGFKILGKSRWIKLKQLDLNGNDFGTYGVRLLVKIDIPKLKILNLNQCKIGQQGMRTLTKAYYPNLTQLYLYYNYINTNTLDNLLLNNWKNLEDLHINKQQNTNIYQINGIVILKWVACRSHNSLNIFHTCSNNLIKNDINNILSNCR